MRPQPRFAIGEVVYYPFLSQNCVVESILNWNELEDVLNQGYRYEIRTNQIDEATFPRVPLRYSVGEEYLAKKRSSPRMNTKGAPHLYRQYPYAQVGK